MRMKVKLGRNKSISLLLILFFAVIVPCMALSLLALRAADRESVYLEKRLENTLLAEVDLATRAVNDLLSTLTSELLESSSGVSGIFDLRPWHQDEILSDVPFLLKNGKLTLIGVNPRREEVFLESFGAFLENGATLPVYDNVAQVYKKELYDMPDEKAGYASSAGISAVLAPAPSAEEDAVKMKKPSSAAQKQLAESKLAIDPKVREEAFSALSEQGFEVSQRNVIPQAAQAEKEAPTEDLSVTVSKNYSFRDLRARDNHGLLPRLTDRGLSLLFWRTTESGDVIGTSIDMNVLKDRLIGRLPALYSDARVLTILDNAGNPIIAPETERAIDWRRPFVSREISPLLPRWEIAAWLTDPDLLSSQAQFTKRVVWVSVAALFLVIAAGSYLVSRMISYEMRIAGQKTTFVATVSHELKTPLTSIRLFAEMLLSGKQRDEEKQKEYLKTMMSEAERLSGLVDNVLAFSKGDGVEYQKQELDIGELAHDVLEQLRPHLEKQGFALSFEKEQDLHVLGNREALKQVFMNIISNAEKYSDKSREISVACLKNGAFAQIRIADRGIGIAPAQAQKIFDEFYRVDESLAALRSGTGLGLSIARNIARKHGGNVRHEPRPGGGSAFILDIPLYHGDGEAKRHDA